MDLDLTQQLHKHWRFFTAVGLVLFLLIGTAYFFYNLQPAVSFSHSDSTDGTQAQIFKIEKGEGFKNITNRLSKLGLIRSLTIFKTYIFFSGRAQHFQPGVYRLSVAMTAPEIAHILTSGLGSDIEVTIPEGLTVDDVDALLAEFQVTKRNEIVSYLPERISPNYEFLIGAESLEGFLFPDTYRFKSDSSPDLVIGKFMDRFQEKAWGILRRNPDWRRKLIIASFLEREVPDFEDRRIVAGIIEKRLSLGMRLQIDSTISYIKCVRKFLNCKTAQITPDDLMLNSPYNTYREDGLTPNPIANPGELALRAATNPAASPFLYYLSAKETKETIFSKTLEEHNKNKERYL